jgi:integrase
VFTAADGAPWTPHLLTNRWRQLMSRLPLPRIRLHDLRHTHATLLLQAGVPVKVVSERLGHTTIAMTMDVYAHVLPAMDRDAATAIGTVLAPQSKGPEVGVMR